MVICARDHAWHDSFNIPIVNCSPISAATLVSKHIVEDQRRAEMIERVYQQVRLDPVMFMHQHL